MKQTIIIDGKKVRDTLLPELKREYDALEEKLKLVVIRIGDFKENELYVRQKRKMARVLGVYFQEIVFSSLDTKQVILEKINELNMDSTVHGIMIQSPVPASLSFLELVDSIDSKKDVDFLTAKNQERLLNNFKILPATVRGIRLLLDFYQMIPKNKKIVILGKSRLVGMPLSMWLKETNEVVVCDSKTENIIELLKNADYVLIAIGKPGWLKKNMLKEGVVVIDIGTTVLDGKLFFFSDFKNLIDYVHAITPVPVGVGPLTVLSLYMNLIDLYHEK